MTKTLLIDGDALVYQLAFSAETSVNWAEIGRPELWTTWANEAETTDRLHRAVAKLQETHNAEGVVFCLTDPEGVFRTDFWPAYKQNRSDTRKPVLHARMREVVQEYYKTFLRPRLEADDLIGILATHPKLIPGEKLIVSDDKDFDTIPAPRVMLSGKGSVFPTHPSVEGADYFFMLQTLTGDTTDNYPGCPGIGEKRADAILKQCLETADYWPAVVAAYVKAGLTEHDALVQARCARILRHTDYDFKNKEPILWTPTLSK